MTFTPEQRLRAVKIRDIIWTPGGAYSGTDEDERIDALTAWCIRATGDEKAGKELAIEAIWS